MTPTDWPSPNTLSWLRLPCCAEEHPTRIEDYTGDHLLVGSPVAPHTEAVRPPRNDGAFFIGWAIPKGAMEVPVKLVQQRSGDIPMWELEAIGPAVETQRRKYVRVDVDLEVDLHLIEGGTPTKVHTTDISEGGVRVILDRWALDPKERRFTVEIATPEKKFELMGQVAWWGPLDPDERRRVGIRFVGMEPAESDELRAYVFRTQLEQRRAKQ